jgi:hypothetical protein
LKENHMRQSKIKMVLGETFVPEHAEPGTVFVCKDTQQTWITRSSFRWVSEPRLPI